MDLLGFVTNSFTSYAHLSFSKRTLQNNQKAALEELAMKYWSEWRVG